MTVSKPETVEATQAIEPCPFCGGDGLTHRVATGWRVSCKNCDAQPRPGFPSGSEAEAVAVWNTRHRLNATPSRQVDAAQADRELLCDLFEIKPVNRAMIMDGYTDKRVRPMLDRIAKFRADIEASNHKALSGAVIDASDALPEEDG